ncbi:hypothetical protein Bpfe_005007 [Biomphalaria pfeifferi]|uniref:Uncharacterized protein n=1 Tax=Biomphalaria pfeifferi TaxID=112525 RepID=A0AAD8C4V6_BIOPF|nr:hypothetical protein Bpfe_005007 [Biomphalaria pfeifferi]
MNPDIEHRESTIEDFHRKFEKLFTYDDSDVTFDRVLPRVSEDDEGGQCFQNVACQRSPNHSKFIPFEMFRIAHLPENHRDYDLYELLKVVADLTVKVKAKADGTYRSRMRYTRMHTGCGRLWNMIKYTDGVNQLGQPHRGSLKTCRCFRCRYSDKPSHIWWEIYVETAANLALDDRDRNLSTCTFFYNSSDSPKFVVDDVTVHSVQRDINTCMLKCMTCKPRLAEKIEQLWRRFDDVWHRVHKKYAGSAEKLAFLVSHPLGSSKHVSVGVWGGTYQSENDIIDESQSFTYSPCTCSDSYGAYIYIVGYEWGIGGWHQLNKLELKY